MRILYLLNFAGKGGTETYVYTLCEAFHKKQADCYFVYNIEGPLCERLTSLGVPCTQLTMRSPYDLAAAKKLADFCRKNCIDIIHTQYPRENYIAVLSKLFYHGTKLVNTNHLIMPVGGVWKIANKIITPHDDAIFSVCHKGKEVLIENGVSQRNLFVMYNGIDLPAERAKSIRSSLGIPDDTFVISSLTRFTPEKGVPFLIDTAKSLRDKTEKSFLFLLAGDGEQFDEMKEKVSLFGLSECVMLLGYRRDADAILASSDCFFNSSSTEALSFAILEALGAGLPVVVTDVGGTRDIVNEETDCGILVPYNDPDKASDAILSLMEDETLRARYAVNGPNVIIERFSRSDMLLKVMTLYKTITHK